MHLDKRIHRVPDTEIVASAHAIPMIMARINGLIVNIAYWAAQRYVGYSIYGNCKGFHRQMSLDMAYELQGSAGQGTMAASN